MRGTGRTTRMLEHALEQARAGRTVYVIAANRDHRRFLVDCVKRLGGAELVDEGSVQVWSAENDRVDLRMLDRPVIGSSRSSVCLVDHFTLEVHAARLRKQSEDLLRQAVEAAAAARRWDLLPAGPPGPATGG